MSETSLCTVSDCAKPIDSRGYCRSHLRRWERHGDPLGGGISKGETLRFIENVVLQYEGDDCFFWPYGKDGAGYGSAHFRGKHVRAHRVVCILAYGEPETGMEAAHSCGNGHLGCVAKNHLRWSTHIENVRDMEAHGTVRRGTYTNMAKLSDEDVLEIYSSQQLPDDKNGQKAADRHGISREQVRRIRNGSSWSWLTERDRLLALAQHHEKLKRENERIDREESSALSAVEGSKG